MSYSTVLNSSIANFIFYTILPLVIIVILNMDIFQVIGKKHYMKNITKAKIDEEAKKIFKSDWSISCVENFIYFAQNKITDLIFFILSIMIYWGFAITTTNKCGYFIWFNYISLFFHIIFLAWFISRLFSMKLKYFFTKIVRKKTTYFQWINIDNINESLLELKSINFNPNSKKDKQQVKQIFQLISQIQYFININDKFPLLSSCLLLYYKLSIYQNSNNNEVIEFVNTKRDNEFYTNTTPSNIEQAQLMLVNKYHLLNKDFQANDIVNVSSTYGYANNSLNKEAYEAFKQLANDAKKEGHTIVILSSYRTYEYQEKLWNRDKDDTYVARPGASEHVTGLAIDVSDFNDKNDSFKDTESYTWMINNCYKYGFILRYPENKENITGYSYEAWHYRYLGIDLATKVYNEGITYDEYYAYYMEK